MVLYKFTSVARNKVRKNVNYHNLFLVFTFTFPSYFSYLNVFFLVILILHLSLNSFLLIS